MFAPARCLLALLCVVGSFRVTVQGQESRPQSSSVLRQANLVAWCIVPFDASKRGPVERAAMLQQLGLTHCAYDWRDEHVSSFEQEILAYQEHGIEMFAFWAVHEDAFRLFEKYTLHPQIWQILGDPGGDDQQAKVEKAAQQMVPLAVRTRDMGCKLGLYNHGGWGGEPENLVAVVQRLRDLGYGHVGIVYNFHHGHGHIEDWPASLKIMLPYLHCLNLNGMNDREQPKILGIGKGTHELAMIREVLNSGYDGPIGILDHRPELDARDSLLENLDGLRWVAQEIASPGSGGSLPADPQPPAPQVQPAAPAPKPAPIDGTSAVDRSRVLPGAAAYRQPPITVQVRATLTRRDQYNILVASDSKQSGDHWELFTMNGSGCLTAYLPGMQPDHVASEAMICDGKPHTLSMTYQADEVALLVDGRTVARQPIRRLDSATSLPGGFAIGRLVEGGLGCSGTIDWVRISKGTSGGTSGAPNDESNHPSEIGYWQFPSAKGVSVSSATDSMELPEQVEAYDPKRVATLSADSQSQGDPIRGAGVFSDVKLACLSCHRVGAHGGKIGPELTRIATERSLPQLIESVLWPKREVKPEYTTWTILSADGQTISGYRENSTEGQITLRDPSSGNLASIAAADVEVEVAGSTVMPDGLTAAMTRQQQLDLFCFLSTLGRDAQPISEAVEHVLANSQSHGPAKFDHVAAPIQPLNWPNAGHRVNRDRVYDYYTKQAEFFRQQHPFPRLLPPFPGLDGGQQGHWGNQDESVWASDRWNETQLDRVQSGVLHLNGRAISRAVCVQLGDDHQRSVCFNPDSLTYEALWADGFVSFSSVRFGFLGGLQIQGTRLPLPEMTSPDQPFQYLGYYRYLNRVVFSYRIGDVEYLDAPWVVDGEFVREVAPVGLHSMRNCVNGGPSQWPQVLETQIVPGEGRPFAVDTIQLPVDNPWKALLFCGGHDVLADGSAMICTMQGDVWHVSGLDTGTDSPGVARWRRFASGLHHPLGLVVASDGIYVQCRDQLTRLVDRNGDGEADFYECFSNAFQTSSAGHDFICGLQRDTQGRFYVASGNEGLVRLSSDGRQAEVIATGFRNPDGVGILDDGSVTVPCSEGEWTPASMICMIPGQRVGQGYPPPHFGYRGPRNGQPPELPLVYLPRGVDNSSGGQTTVSGGAWGPLDGQLLHFSFGTGAWFLILRDTVGGQQQGAVVPMAGEFLSGAHRGRFSPRDKQLYVSGMAGWGTYTPEDGCFQRVRYTGDPLQVVTEFRVHENGVRVTFAKPVDPGIASERSNQFAQCWNYHYSGAYGSPEYSPSHRGVQGHDPLAIAGVHLLPDGRSIFLEIPDLQPVNQLHLRMIVNSEQEYLSCNPSGSGHDMFVTVHRMDVPFTEFDGYKPSEKIIAAHPMLTDLAIGAAQVANPWEEPIRDARPIELETGKNLSYVTREVHVNAGEPISLTLINPDGVPHNWVLVRPGKLKAVGQLANQLIADPQAFVRHYVPESPDVLCYTDIVGPGERQTIHFQAPLEPGRYPFLCSFPGHWMVMNGELIVGPVAGR